MTRYRTFARVDVRHDYFADGRARDLQFVAAPSTQAFLERFSLITHNDGQCLALIAEETRLAGIWSERLDEDGTPRQLRFELRSRDWQSAYYTESANLRAPVEYRVDPTAPGQLIAQPASTAPAARPPAARAIPLGVIVLPINASTSGTQADWEAALGGDYRLQLHARSTVWKYLLLGDWQDHTLRLVDPQNQIAFSPPSAETLPDGRRALVIRSSTAIELQERPQQRFQLRDSSSTPEKVLIQRLPAAAPRGLYREDADDATSTVSEIFVNR
jgi:hypothetical protein